MCYFVIDHNKMRFEKGLRKHTKDKCQSSNLK